MLWNCLLCSIKEFAWLFSRPYLLETYTGIFTGQSIWCLGFVFKYFRRKKNRWNKNDGIIILIILQLWLWVPGVHHVIFCTFKYVRNFFARRGFFKRENILSSIFQNTQLWQNTQSWSWKLCLHSTHNDETDPLFPGGKDKGLSTWLVDVETIQGFKRYCFSRKSSQVIFNALIQSILEFDSLSPFQPEMLPDPGFNQFFYYMYWLQQLHIFSSGCGVAQWNPFC